MEARERQLEELQTLYSIFDSDLNVLDEGLTKFFVDGDAGFVDDSQRIDFDIRLELQVDTRCVSLVAYNCLLGSGACAVRSGEVQNIYGIA
jgi:hypothetical protein